MVVNYVRIELIIGLESVGMKVGVVTVVKTLTNNGHEPVKEIVLSIKVLITVCLKTTFDSTLLKVSAQLCWANGVPFRRAVIRNLHYKSFLTCVRQSKLRQHSTPEGAFLSSFNEWSCNQLFVLSSV